MAMLQLGGAFSHTTVRICPRISLWVTAQHFANVSSVAPNPDAVENAVKEPIKVFNKVKYPSKKLPGDETLVTAAFKYLNNHYMPTNRKNNTREQSFLDSNIRSAKTVDQLLDTVNHPEFREKNASNVVHVLCNWITTGAVAMIDIQSDERYLKVCRILGIEKQSANPLDIMSSNNENYKLPYTQILQTENVNKQIENLNTSQIISVLIALANRHKRVTPTLKLLAQKISLSDDILNIKQLSDILYSMAILNFYDEMLLKKVCIELSKLVPKTDSAAVIRSLLKSLGILRYRNEALLDLLFSWVAENENIIRSNEICGLLMTLAQLGYTPNNFNKVFESIVLPLKESDMCQSSEWLDIVWALTILDKATSQHYESVLNDSFLNRIFDTTDTVIARVIKLLNVNAAARFCEDYQGPFIPENSSLLNTPLTRPKDKIELSNSIISALKILLPSDSVYLNTNVITDMGLLIDAEICVDSNCTPLPLDSKSEGDKKVFRIALVTCSYQEFCRNKKEIIGPIKFYNKLLTLKGYKVLLLPYSDINIKDKLVVRVKYIKDNITQLLQDVPMQ
ncbi:uncharacterized protein LOC131671287 [Phymastichus coffea]|uniref:uncharacterized protein LOC131671287 n=1 Tax=Phymastichus coffea TaxID=108790 RepID=UPI00273C49EB|nr:uncharacterized protein LOC131671287 [Phymastichus coffea]XP_058803571.1 uncharacterized protein LOC131671287 [Phymastichus coffea]XP_058803572.1 uncharacterized protein LOC131671287 [Phymastichus coffea]XP_058803573.1 uncharacterized protein LOC131671287 [Phymastichus coffea]XP_058803574.1 uncharacterized protein LOC131671287 [Phymastichus coffea]